ncbi:MAG TPA: ABC transporter permease [Ohtaekwangia sp.]|uniref:ABC transporter permease n=1 Tax=Ohtaekwangia sp. TaxID=2066019 RepID=UPI002F939E1B
MLRNYIQVALRNLRRHKFFSFINIFGLAIGMSICLGIMMLVADQMMYDRYNTKRDRVYRIITRYLNPDGSMSGNDMSTAPQPLASILQEEYTGISKAVRIRRGFGNMWLDIEPGRDINIPLSGFFVDPEALDVFEYELELGDAKTALRDPYSVVLTKNAAKKLFRQDNPLGEVIKVGKLGDYKVTGVLKDNGRKSHIVFEGLASYSTIKSLEADSTFNSADSGWDNFTAGWVYLLLEPGHIADEVESKLSTIAKKQQQATQPGDKQPRGYIFYLQNLSSITPGPLINNPIGPFMPMLFVYFFGGLALIIMITSCFNYTNLSIARALTRAREIGVRKVNGAFRYQIFFQFISEAVIISLFALALSLLFLLAVKPFMLNLQFAKALKWDLEGNVYVYGIFALFSVVIGMLAGFFPAVILSKFQPAKVLKNISGMKLFSRLALRKSLLVIQFTLSLIFIISVLLLYNQLQLFVRADHGFSMERKINVRLSNTSYASLKTQLNTYSNIENVAGASHMPAIGVTYGDGFKRELHEKDSKLLDYFFVDEDYLANMDIQLVAGKNFDSQNVEHNKKSILLNEEAVKEFQFTSPHDAVGEILYLQEDSSRYEIIGVIKNYNHQMMVSKLEAMALRYDPEQFKMVQVKYTGPHDEAVKNIESAWARINPTLKVDYKDFDEEVRSFYKTVFSDFVSIIGIIAFMAIVISCLGLLGMATYLTETRMKEISIRKILGSSDRALVVLLSKGFFMLLIFAIVLAVPIAWLINNMWLEQIAYRTELNFNVIALGVLILILLGGITIGSQTVRAAFANPVDNLKND